MFVYLCQASAFIKPSLHQLVKIFFYGDLIVSEFFDCYTYIVAAFVISPAHTPTVIIILSLHGQIHVQRKWHPAW